MLKNNFTDFLEYIFDNSDVKKNVIEITIKYKNEPKLGLPKIQDIAKIENYDITEEEITAITVDFLKFKYELGNIITTYRKEDNDPLESQVRISKTFDQLDCEVLEGLDQDFLKNLYFLDVGNFFGLDFNKKTFPCSSVQAAN
ncbi:hypothetical protein [Nostoc sp.]|uniref:hypothetical protein n=1 Tax=Nostoc sp. TaxID=1180 RepID=UPI002FF5E4AB